MKYIKNPALMTKALVAAVLAFSGAYGQGVATNDVNWVFIIAATVVAFASVFTIPNAQPSTTTPQVLSGAK